MLRLHFIMSQQPEETNTYLKSRQKKNFKINPIKLL